MHDGYLASTSATAPLVATERDDAGQPLVAGPLGSLLMTGVLIFSEQRVENERVFGRLDRRGRVMDLRMGRIIRLDDGVRVRRRFELAAPPATGRGQSNQDDQSKCARAGS